MQEVNGIDIKPFKRILRISGSKDYAGFRRHPFCKFHVRYLEAYEELKTQQKSVELAERNYRTTATRYSAGMALITDMLDAANSKLDAEQQLVNARINIIYYYYKLLFTTGKI